jgi:hypothetical protein
MAGMVGAVAGDSEVGAVAGDVGIAANSCVMEDAWAGTDVKSGAGVCKDAGGRAPGFPAADGVKPSGTEAIGADGGIVTVGVACASAT